MPTPRKYATNAERQAAYRARCVPPTASGARLPSLPGYRRWARLLGQVQELLTTLTAEMTIYAAARSEAWHDSDRGEAFLERLDALAALRDEVTDWGGEVG